MNLKFSERACLRCQPRACPLYGSRRPWEAATQLAYAHRRLSPPLPTEADGNRTQTARRYRCRPLRLGVRVVPLPRVARGAFAGPDFWRSLRVGSVLLAGPLLAASTASGHQKMRAGGGSCLATPHCHCRAQWVSRSVLPTQLSSDPDGHAGGTNRRDAAWSGRPALACPTHIRVPIPRSALH